MTCNECLWSSQLCENPDGRRWRCGATAANRLADYVGSRPVTCIPASTDRYGRTIARCSVAGHDLGQWAVENGWAFAFQRYSRDYVRAEGQAIAARRGVHGSTCERPWDYRATKRNAGRKPWE